MSIIVPVSFVVCHDFERRCGNMSSLTLNIVPIEFSADTVTIGRLRIDKSTYEDYRNKYSNTHAFRYDSASNEVHNIPIRPDIKPLGDEVIVRIIDYLPLLARGIQQSIFGWLSNNLRIIRKGKKIIFWGKQDTSLLLSQAARILRVPIIPNLEVDKSL